MKSTTRKKKVGGSLKTVYGFLPTDIGCPLLTGTIEINLACSHYIL